MEPASTLQPGRMITYRIDSARRLVLVTMTGTPSAAEISANQAELRAHPDFDPVYALLADFSKASFAAIAPADVRQHAMQDPFGPASPRAVVARQESDFSIVKMFEVYSELSARTGPVKAFTDIASALAWIESMQAKSC